MGLLDTLRSGVAIADSITKELQPLVTFERWTGQDEYGEPTYATATSLRAIVDWKQKQLRTLAGDLTVSRASVLFLDPTAVAVATNGQGISDDDRITLPDGTTGRILDMGGFIDAGTGRPLATEVWLG